jgi:hypothetical protein
MIDLRTFRRICYEAARRTGGRLIEFHIARPLITGFYQGVIGYRDHRVAVVWNPAQALLAVAEPRVVGFDAIESGPLTFIDAPELLAVLAEQPGFRVLTTSDLNAPFDAAAWPGIGAADIKYWKPATVGEALFNYWD